MKAIVDKKLFTNKNSK